VVLKGFREFIVRGNVVDLAVGIVIGAAFTTVVNQFVASFLNPLVRLFTGGTMASGTWQIRPGIVMDWAAFFNAMVSFLITAAALYFLVVAPINRLNEFRRRRQAPAEEEMSDEVRLLTEIRDALTRQTR
jgi:large conductance mechanosensitive channel